MTKDFLFLKALFIYFYFFDLCFPLFNFLFLYWIAVPTHVLKHGVAVERR